MGTFNSLPQNVHTPIAGVELSHLMTLRVRFDISPSIVTPQKRSGVTAMPLIARYPKRVPKQIETVLDKPIYSVAEVCVLLGYSRSTVIRMFEDERVLIRLHSEKMYKRRRRVTRIPRAVVLRVRAKLEQDS
jgi:hypothetical protein